MKNITLTGIKKYFTLEGLMIVLIITAPFLIEYFFEIKVEEITFSFLGVIIFLAFLVIFGRVSYVFFKSLFFVGAELSLLIFIAQSYSSSITEVTDNNLQTFILLGLIFILLKFIKDILPEMKNIISTMRGEEKIEQFIFYLLFALSSIVSITLFIRIFGNILKTLM